MKNYIKAQFTFVTKGLIWKVWIYSFTIFFVLQGAIKIYRSTYDSYAWFSAGTGDILFGVLFLCFCLVLESSRKMRGLFADIFKGWDETIKDNKRLMELCEKFRKENEALKAEKKTNEKGS